MSPEDRAILDAVIAESAPRMPDWAASLCDITELTDHQRRALAQIVLSKPEAFPDSVLRYARHLYTTLGPFNRFDRVPRGMHESTA